MTKATLTFNLPEEIDEYKDAQNGANYRGALVDIRNYLRNMTKYDTYEDAKTKEDLARKIYDRFNEILTENDVDVF